MLSYQSSFFTATEPLTSEIFSQLIISDKVVNTIAEVRRLKDNAYEEQKIADSLPPDDPRAKSALAFKEAYDQQAASEKRKLPKIIWQATFDETTSKKGYTGRWRKQSAARLNGLFMLDIDHVTDPKEMFYDWVRQHHNVANANVTADMIKQWAHDLKIPATAIMASPTV